MQDKDYRSRFGISQSAINQDKGLEEDAKKYSIDAIGSNYPMYSDYDLVRYERMAYIKGRLDERKKNWTDEQVEDLISFIDDKRKEWSDLPYAQWLEEYRKK